jgi:hypothetical protein
LVVQAADDGLIVLREASMYGGTPDRPNIGVWLSPPPIAAEHLRSERQSLWKRLGS